jgi:hypothetical protein
MALIEHRLTRHSGSENRDPTRSRHADDSTQTNEQLASLDLIEETPRRRSVQAPVEQSAQLRQIHPVADRSEVATAFLQYTGDALDHKVGERQ